MSEKLTINMDELTLRELHEIRKLAGEPLEVLMAGEDQALGLAAIVCVMQRRTIPDFTLDQAWDMRLHDLELVGGDPGPEALSGASGDTPRPSLASGLSTP